MAPASITGIWHCSKTHASVSDSVCSFVLSSLTFLTIHSLPRSTATSVLVPQALVVLDRPPALAIRVLDSLRSSYCSKQEDTKERARRADIRSPLFSWTLNVHQLGKQR